jgi:hypothetical protein
MSAEGSAIAGSLKQGVQVLDLQAEICFTRYNRAILPIDGFIFWVPAGPLNVQGSLHFSQDIQQNEDETYGAVTVSFTTTERISEFEICPIDTIYVGEAVGVQFAFAQQGARYDQAGLWHYSGRSIPPAMSTQLITDQNLPDPKCAVVSNSLPFWLQLNNYAAPLPGLFSNTKLTLYPSFLSLPNVRPPYATVHIGPGDTRTLQMAPSLGPSRTHTQLCADRVRIPMYGLQNDAALDFMDTVLQYSLFSQNFGITVTPTMRDGKRPMAEIQALGMQKIMDLEVSYLQSRANDVARQLIEKALVTVIANPNVIPV